MSSPRRFPALSACLAAAGLTVALLAACRPAVLDPPRLATQAAQQALTATVTPTAIISSAPTATGTPPAPTATAVTAEAITRRSLTLWVNETSAAHQEALSDLIIAFEAESDIHVELILVMPNRQSDLVSTAAISGTLPDLILHPIEYTMGWTADGILDPAVATEVVEQLGRETFDPTALQMVEVAGQAGQVAAIPSDGWQQLLIYRADWFEEQGLAPPVSYTAIISGAEAFYRPEELRSGLVVPTEANLVSTSHVFEHLAIANGCQLVDDKGEILIYRPPCAEALDYYRRLVNQFSPSDVQTDLSALNAYLAGRTAIIMTSPSVLPVLAGLDPAHRPSCAECADPAYLAANSGILTHLEGSGSEARPANFGEFNLLGITTTADREAAARFAAYWFEEGYLQWLAVEPERKSPLRLGTAGDPGRFRQAWSALPLVEGGPGLTELYGAALVEQLGQDIAASERWGFRQGQGALVSRVYEELLMSIVLQEMLSGYFDSRQSAIEAYKRTVALIPEYAYYIELDPTPTPTPRP